MYVQLYCYLSPWALESSVREGLEKQVSTSNGSSNKSVSKEKQARGRRVDIRTLSVVLQYVLEKYTWNLFWIDTI